MGYSSLNELKNAMTNGSLNVGEFIGGFSNAVRSIYEFAKNNDYYNAQKLANYLHNLNKSLFLDINPICVKYYLNLIGFNVGKPRLPLTEPSSKIKSKLKEIKKYYEN